MAGAVFARGHVDDAARWLGPYGAWTAVVDIQSPGRATWRGQTRVYELADVHGAAKAWQGHAAVPADAVGGGDDIAASGVPAVIPDRRDVQGRGTGGPS